jgi:hypothetical protein
MHAHGSRSKNAAGSPCFRKHSFQSLHTSYGYGNRPEFLLHFAPQDEGALVEQDVPAGPVDVGKEYRLDQPGAIVESGELHRLVFGGVDRLGGGEHAGEEHLPAHVAMELGGPHQPEPAQGVLMQRHGMAVGAEAEQLVLGGAAAVRGIFR